MTRERGQADRQQLDNGVRSANAALLLVRSAYSGLSLVSADLGVYN